MGSPIPALAAARIVRTDRELVQELREVGATTAARAVALRRTPLRSRRINRLTGEGVLNPAEQDRFYLDEEAWQRYQSRRQRRIAIMLGIVVGIVVIGLGFGFFTS